MKKVNKTRFVIMTPEDFGRVQRHVCYGIKEAEAKADEIITQNADNYCDYYVKCFEGVDHPEYRYEDYLCRRRDYDGENGWVMMRMGSYMPIGMEQLNTEEEMHLNELYDE